MAEYNFFNYGKAIGDAQSIIDAKQKNAINAYKLEEAENVFKKRKQREEILAQVKDTPSRIQALSDAGQVEGAMELAESYIGIQTKTAELMEQQALQLNATTWDDFRYEQIKNGARSWEIPEDYDPGWANSQIKQIQSDIKNVTTILGPNEEGRVMAQDTMLEGGQRVKGKPYDYASTKRASSTAGGYKAADANTIRNTVRPFFGSLIDPATKEFRILDPATESKIAGVQAEAERLFSSGQFPTHLAAAEEAFKQFERPVAAKPRNRDPAGIRRPRQ